MPAPLSDKIAQLEHVIRTQMVEIDQLRAEVDGLVDWIAGGPGLPRPRRLLFICGTLRAAGPVKNEAVCPPGGGGGTASSHSGWGDA
jgi:hypothetical protein